MGSATMTTRDHPIDDNQTTDQRWAIIEAKMRKARRLLVTEGCVTQRRLKSGRVAWSVRYRERVGDRCIHRAICIDRETHADRARKLIRKWRIEAVTPEERRQRELLRLLGLTASVRGYSKRAKRRLTAAIEEASKDPRDALKLVMSLRHDDDAIRFGRPPGRPAKSALW